MIHPLTLMPGRSFGGIVIILFFRIQYDKCQRYNEQHQKYDNQYWFPLLRLAGVGERDWLLTFHSGKLLSPF